MKIFRMSFAVVMIAVLCCATPGFASEATHRAAIEEMLKITNVDKIVDQVIAQFESMLNNQFNQMDSSGKDKPILKKYNAKLVKIMKDEMAWGKMKDQYIDIYMKVYSEDEINEINKFYKSPVGQKMVKKMPELTKESMALTRKSLQRILPKIKQMTEEMAAEINQAQK